MDKTKEYILMCEKAKRFIPKEVITNLDYHTFWAQKHHGEWIVDARGCIPKDDIPLFRQDQSQEMLAEDWDEQLLIADVLRSASNESGIDWDAIDSHEKMWLAFVMYEKFNKTWNGEDWISEKE